MPHGTRCRCPYSTCARTAARHAFSSNVSGWLRSQALQQALAALSERERQVLVLRYGLDDDEPKTLDEIGCQLSLTRERIRQIQVEALRRLASLREIQAIPH